MTPPVEIRRSRRRTVSLSITDDLRVLLKVPLGVTDAEAAGFLQRHRRWIEKHLRLCRERRARAPSFSPEQVAALKERAARFAAERVPRYAAEMGVAPAGVKITSAVTRWGSCSGKNRLCFSYRIALLPPEAAEYVVVHELAHIRVKNHGPGFYAEVARYLPDYRRRIALLKRAQRELGL